MGDCSESLTTMSRLRGPPFPCGCRCGRWIDIWRMPRFLNREVLYEKSLPHDFIFDAFGQFALRVPWSCMNPCLSSLVLFFFAALENMNAIVAWHGARKK